MNISSCFYLGYISKTVGHNGELTFKLDVNSPSFYKNIPMVFIQFYPEDEHLVPFFLNSSQLRSNNLLYCKIEDVNSEKEAKKLVGKKLYLPNELLPPVEEDQLHLYEILNFKIIDQQKGEIGHVIDILEIKDSQILSISYQGKEILIPVNEETILEIDLEEKSIYISAADGLIDLYLDS